MKLLLGTKIYVDFPTLDAIIYPREVIELALLNARPRIDEGTVIGGIFDGPHAMPKDGIITHVVTDIRIYNGEIIVEMDTVDNKEANALLDTIKHKKAAIIIKVPKDQGGPGSIVRKITSIECVHIREDQYAQPNRNDSENQDSGGQERESGPNA